MGVKHFWDIVDEAKSINSLDCLRGKILSVDMSIWIVEAIKTLQFKTSILKPHLRNMFYRILFLRRLGIKLIFVTEGDPPELKQETMKQRMREQYGTKIKTKQKVGRSRFQRIINECCEMLDYLGIPHVRAAGEAEAMCAVLSRLGLTDGCLTNDSDFFLYGGQVIYRDFGINPKDPHVLTYTTDDIYKRVGICREDMVALALLCGCDYTNGVSGVGKGLVVNFLQEKNFDENLLQRFSSWYSNSHDDSEYVPKSETIVLKKALKSENFLNKKIIDEYLLDKDLINKQEIIEIRKKLFWKYPHISNIQDFLLAKLEWPHEYTLGKVLQLASSTYLEKLADGTFYSVPISPVLVVKQRCQQGVALVELEWKLDTSDENTTHSSKWKNCPEQFNTLENQQVVLRVLPKLVEEFTEKKKAKGSKKAPKKTRGGTDTVIEAKGESQYVDENVEELCNKIADLSTTTKTKNVVEEHTSLKKTNESLMNDESSADDQDDEVILPLSQRLALKRLEPIKTSAKNHEKDPEIEKNNNRTPLRVKLHQKACNEEPELETTSSALSQESILVEVDQLEETPLTSVNHDKNQVYDGQTASVHHILDSIHPMSVHQGIFVEETPVHHDRSTGDSVLDLMHSTSLCVDIQNTSVEDDEFFKINCTSLEVNEEGIKLDKTQVSDPEETISLKNNDSFQNFQNFIVCHSPFDKSPQCCDVETPSEDKEAVLVNQIEGLLVDELNFSDLGSSILDDDTGSYVETPKKGRSNRGLVDDCSPNVVDLPSPLCLADRLKARLNSQSRK